MKKMFSLLIMLCMFTAVCACAETRVICTEGGTSVFLRTEPTTESAVCGMLPNGSTVDVLEANGSWSKIRTDADVAWIRTKYLADSAEAAAAPEEEDEAESIAELDFSSFRQVEPYYALVVTDVTGGFVNLRWAPSRDARVQHRVNDGAELLVIAADAEWSQVQDERSGFVGFIQNRYLLPIEAAAN